RRLREGHGGGRQEPAARRVRRVVTVTVRYDSSARERGGGGQKCGNLSEAEGGLSFRLVSGATSHGGPHELQAAPPLAEREAGPWVTLRWNACRCGRSGDRPWIETAPSFGTRKTNSSCGRSGDRPWIETCCSRASIRARRRLRPVWGPAVD